MKSRVSVLLMLAVAMCYQLYAQQDTLSFRAASALPVPADKILALEEFVKQYPDSKLKAKAFDGLFDLYLDQGNETGSVGAASRFLGTLPPEGRMNPYNRFAYALATRNIGLDSALVYAVRSEELAQATKARGLTGIQDTRAYVLYRVGKFAEAEQLQRIAIQGHERDPEFIGHLALYEKENGKLHNGLATMAKALYLGAEPEMKEQFLEWIAAAETEKANQDELKKTVVMSMVHSATDTLKGDEQVAARADAAVLMADLGVDLATAQKWAEAAERTLNKRSPLADVVTFNEGLSLVLMAQGKYKEALTHLRAIESIVDPYDLRYWNALGSTYGQLGDTRSAIHAYMQALVPRNDRKMRGTLETLYAKEYGTTDGIDRALDSLKKANVTFDPGRYEKSPASAGKVVLAELFTGAECGPCAGSDIAVDALGEYYPRSAVAIIEYHVHVPGPDPMTTNESWDRYKLYDGQGTPTVIIDGKESMIGGGSKFVAKNRFGVYRYAIQKVVADKPKAGLSLSVRNELDRIAVELQVTPAKGSAGVAQPVVHIALVERSVDYSGSNGIEKHAFVVRSMVDGANGTALSWKSQTIRKQISLADVEKGIREYLDDPTSQRSWQKNRGAFAGWKARPEKLNRSNLAIVAWVQDMKTNEVLQAVYHDVSPPMGMK